MKLSKQDGFQAGSEKIGTCFSETGYRGGRSAMVGCDGLPASVRSVSAVSGTVKSIDIMTVRTNMVRTEKTNIFFAQSRSSEVLKPDRAMISHIEPTAVAAAR